MRAIFRRVRIYGPWYWKEWLVKGSLVGVFAITALLLAPLLFVTLPHVGYDFTGPQHGHVHRAIVNAWLSHNQETFRAYNKITLGFAAISMILVTFVFPYWIFFREFARPWLRHPIVLAIFATLVFSAANEVSGDRLHSHTMDWFLLGGAIFVVYGYPCLIAYFVRLARVNPAAARALALVFFFLMLPLFLRERRTYVRY